MRSVVQKCQINKIPVFVKQMGGNVCEYGKGSLAYSYSPPGWKKGKDIKFGDSKYFPLDLQVREFPP
nr:hypothetical protein [Trichormus azollae]